MRRLHVRRPLPAMLVALAAAGLALGAPRPAEAFQIGLQDDEAFVSASPAERSRAFDDAHAIGVTYLRITLCWEAFRGEGWAPYDAAVDEARRRGMSVQLAITGTPKFTAGGRGYITYLNPHPGRFGTWAHAVALHFRGRVRFYSLWNEPNLNAYLAPQIVRRRAYGHKLYARLVRSGYAAIKKADPRAKVLIGESAPSGHPLRFIERAAKSVPGGLRADGFAQHPYQFLKIPPGSPQARYTGGISNIATMKTLMRRLAKTTKLRTPAGKPLPLYLTEFGYPRPGAYYGFFSEALRADYTVRAYQLAKSSGVKVLVWYQLYSTRPVAPKLWDTALIVGGSPSPVYDRLAALRRSLAGF